MKRSVFRICGMLTACLCVIPILLLICGFALPAQYGDTFLGEMPEKLRRLQNTEGKRIVIIGGSSVPFALDSAALEQQIPDYQVVDFGMYADMGTVVMLDWAKTQVHPGDIFVIAPEQNPQALSCYVGGEDVWQASDGAYSQVFLLSSQRFEALAAAFPAFAGKKLGYFLSGAPEPNGIYAKSSFNAYGDIAYPDRQANILSLGYDPNHAITFSQDVISEDFIEALNQFARDITAKGGRVIYHFCPMNAAAVEEGPLSIDEYYDYLQSKLLFPILGDPNRCILDSGWFYDSNFHLNESGCQVFTKLLAEDIKLYLEDTSPTDIPLPAMPGPENTDIEGDDSQADCFTYESVEGGWIANGLTDIGHAASSLTVPTHYQGAPVIGISETLFHNNTTVSQITLQSNIGTLYDGMFRGCTGLSRLILTGSPSDYTVGDGLMDGAQFLIYVPESTLDDYRRSYFWQHYASYLQPLNTK